MIRRQSSLSQYLAQRVERNNMTDSISGEGLGELAEDFVLPRKPTPITSVIYQLKGTPESSWNTVTKEQYVAAERAAGYDGGDEPVNRGFHQIDGVCGRVLIEGGSNLFDPS